MVRVQRDGGQVRFIQMTEPRVSCFILFYLHTSRCRRSSCSSGRPPCGCLAHDDHSVPGRAARPGATGVGGPAGLPWCRTTAVANGLLPRSQRQKLTFPEALPAGGRLPLSPPSTPPPPVLLQGEKIPKRWLKTTMRQLCQHGRPSSRKHFYNNRRRGAKLTIKPKPAAPPHLHTNTHTLKSTLWCQVTGYLSHLHAHK